MRHEINLHEVQWHRLSEGQRDWLLVKGSRGMRMERLIEELERRQPPVD